jgi:hypothetical protein
MPDSRGVRNDRSEAKYYNSANPIGSRRSTSDNPSLFLYPLNANEKSTVRN